MKFISYLHKVNSGDIIASLAGIKKVSEDLGKKAIIYQQLNVQGNYYQGAVHPVENNGMQVTMNQQMFDMLRPLLLSQDYIEDFRVWKGEKVQVDLNKIRGEVFSNMPFGSINRWLFYAYPDMACDLSKAWLNLSFAGMTYRTLTYEKILINRTQRYQNPSINYFFLKDYLPNVVFTGTEKEHRLFCNEWNLDIPRLEVDNFLQLAQAIQGCKLFLGNQSMCWNIAEALKVPRIVEACSFAPNCIPHGENAYDFYHQGALEYYVTKLYNGTRTSV